VNPKDQALEVWGELACFSDIKTERFSYPVITPSAARGIYDAIYCKRTEFRWQVTQIEVLKWCPDDEWTSPRYIALKRNEVTKRAPAQCTIQQWMSGAKPPKPILADDTTEHEVRVQRQTMALRNVRYRFHAEIRPWPGFEDQLQAFEAQFRRRAARGQCIYQPYLGCREFPAYFELIDPDGPLPDHLPWNADLGYMLYDCFDLSRPGDAHSEWRISLFKAEVTDGVLQVPDYEDARVLKPEGG